MRCRLPDNRFVIALSTFRLVHVRLFECRPHQVYVYTPETVVWLTNTSEPHTNLSYIQVLLSPHQTRIHPKSMHPKSKMCTRSILNIFCTTRSVQTYPTSVVFACTKHTITYTPTSMHDSKTLRQFRNMSFGRIIVSCALCVFFGTVRSDPSVAVSKPSPPSNNTLLFVHVVCTYIR